MESDGTTEQVKKGVVEPIVHSSFLFIVAIINQLWQRQKQYSRSGFRLALLFEASFPSHSHTLRYLDGIEKKKERPLSNCLFVLFSFCLLACYAIARHDSPISRLGDNRLDHSNRSSGHLAPFPRPLVPLSFFPIPFYYFHPWASTIVLCSIVRRTATSPPSFPPLKRIGYPLLVISNSHCAIYTNLINAAVAGHTTRTPILRIKLQKKGGGGASWKMISAPVCSRLFLSSLLPLVCFSFHTSQILNHYLLFQKPSSTLFCSCTPFAHLFPPLRPLPPPFTPSLSLLFQRKNAF
jgi:hypothetical protein